MRKKNLSPIERHNALPALSFYEVWCLPPGTPVFVRWFGGNFGVYKIYSRVNRLNQREVYLFIPRFGDSPFSVENMILSEDDFGGSFEPKVRMLDEEELKLWHDRKEKALYE